MSPTSRYGQLGPVAFTVYRHNRSDSHTSIAMYLVPGLFILQCCEPGPQSSYVYTYCCNRHEYVLFSPIECTKVFLFQPTATVYHMPCAGPAWYSRGMVQVLSFQG